MPVRILLPLRSISDGKRRLAPVLTDEQRRRLVLSLFLSTLKHAARVVGGDSVLVVSPSKDVLETAAANGVRVLLERGEGGLNGALEQASRAAGEAGATSVLALSCDLPLLTASDVHALLEAATQAAVVIAPDEAGTGTNALLTTPPGFIAFCFGTQSFAAHCAAAEAAGVQPFVLRQAGLGCDLDTPADLERLRTRHGWALPAV